MPVAEPVDQQGIGRSGPDQVTGDVVAVRQRTADDRRRPPVDAAHMLHQITHFPARAAGNTCIQVGAPRRRRQPQALGTELIKMLFDLHATHCASLPAAASAALRRHSWRVATLGNMYMRAA